MVINVKTYQAKLATPFAMLGVLTEAGRLTGIDFLPLASGALAPQNTLAKEVCRQLLAYVRDPAYRFDLPLSIDSTPHRMKVWQALMQIPSGTVLHYGDLAVNLGSSPRAIGQACGANPVPLIIPCHRVLAKSGIGGFMHHSNGAPLLIKQWLLRHENVE